MMSFRPRKHAVESVVTLSHSPFVVLSSFKQFTWNRTAKQNHMIYPVTRRVALSGTTDCNTESRDAASWLLIGVACYLPIVPLYCMQFSVLSNILLEGSIRSAHYNLAAARIHKDSQERLYIVHQSSDTIGNRRHLN